MSQSTKRDAEAAFDGDSVDLSARKKRPRRKAGNKSRNDQSTNTSDKHERSRVVQPPLDDIPASSKLENRITIPNPVPTPSVRTKIEDSRSSKSKQRQKKSEKQSSLRRTTRNQKSDPESWKMSTISGGIFIHHDPILTDDGQYLVLPTSDRILVYSTSTSLLVRSIVAKEKDSVNCCSMSATNTKILFVATRRGTVVKLDLDTGNQIGQWKTGPGVKFMRSAIHEQSTDKLLILKSVESGGDEMSLYLLHSGGRLESRSLYEHDKPQRLTTCSSDMSTIISCTGNKVYLGRQDSQDTQKYLWHTFTVQGPVVSFDFRTTEQTSTHKKLQSVDVVVGLENGAIFVYENILTSLVKAAKSGQKVDLSGRKLHWHRNPVRCVKWSKDGNYIISGGDETVLVIWQLETNQQQFLPHLSTSILNLTVSAAGAHYALRLGDNSVMVLSTADLSPSTNVSGLSIPIDRTERTPMLLHPAHPDRLLATVSIRQGHKDSNGAATHLQTYDIDTSLQLNRQALTRNVTTAVNVSPNGRALQEPSVTHIQVSSDGNWLATADTWSPQSLDMQALHLEEDQTAKQKHTETILRFWSWSSADNSWDLVTRVDDPHAAGKFAIVGLTSNPTSSEFATMGEDGLVKVWKPKRRMRDGVQVRNKSGQALFNWSCVCTVQAEKSELVSTTRQPFGAITYSSDGSVLMASWSRPSRHVHVVDPRSATLCMSLPALLAEGQASMAIVGRNLLCLSTSFRIFDMITLQTTFAMSIERHHGSFLAVDERTNSFAIGLNPQDRKLPAVISIFNIENPDQGSTTDFEIHGQIRALLAGASTRGYVVIDHECLIRRLTPPGPVASASMTLARLPDVVENESGKGLEDVFGNDRNASIRGQEQQKLLEGASSVRSLADLLHAPSTSSQLGVSELFDRVSKAISGGVVQVGA